MTHNHLWLVLYCINNRWLMRLCFLQHFCWIVLKFLHSRPVIKPTINVSPMTPWWYPGLLAFLISSASWNVEKGSVQKLLSSQTLSPRRSISCIYVCFSLNSQTCCETQVKAGKEMKKGDNVLWQIHLAWHQACSTQWFNQSASYEEPLVANWVI